MFSLHMKTKSRKFKIPPVFKQLRRFREGLVWTIGLTIERMLSFQISPA